MSATPPRKAQKSAAPRGVPPAGSDDDDRARAEHYANQSRRRFLRHAALVSTTTVAAGWAALAPSHWPLSVRDPDGERGKPRPPVIELPAGGFAVAARVGAADLGVARGRDVGNMLRAALDAVGGLEHYIRRGDVVVIKPNVAFERAAALGATTNPEVLHHLVKLVRAAGASEVRVVDNPIEAAENCFERSGIRRAALDAGARVFLPLASDFRLLHTPGASLIAEWPFFWRPFVGADKVIGVAPVKDHNLCSASMTTKNWYGLLGGRRNQFHQDIHGIIADLALMMRPTLVVLDGVRVLHRSGPTGGSLADVRQGDTLVVARDSLAADAFGWDDLLRRKGESLPAYFAKVEARKLGRADWRSLLVKEIQVG